MRKLLLSLSMLLMASVANAAQTIVVPFPPGGSTDLVARIISKYYSEKLGKELVVENKPGAGGHVGAQYVANAAKDGNTILFGTIGIHSAYALQKNLQYDPSTALKPVILLVELPLVVCVNNKLPVNSLKELVDYAQKNNVNFSSAGFGSSTHLTGEAFKMASKSTNMKHIPYKGSAPALVAAISGEVEVMFEQIPAAYPQIASGAIKAVAVTSDKRLEILPNVPTVAELGYPGFKSTSWFTLSVPAGTPDAVVQQINKEMNTMLKDPQIIEQLSKMNFSIIGGTPKKAADHYRNEKIKWNSVIEFAGGR